MQDLLSKYYIVFNFIPCYNYYDTNVEQNNITWLKKYHYNEVLFCSCKTGHTANLNRVHVNNPQIIVCELFNTCSSDFSIFRQHWKTYPKPRTISDFVTR